MALDQEMKDSDGDDNDWQVVPATVDDLASDTEKTEIRAGIGLALMST